ncbi:uncharacterized protein LOC113276349 [Papaver somniferum]|uniref:uncharacterized protein LOC113276349 n=1 Tax=Papaver somniferum TaxID=3469 RepID=UPI000E6F5012|nr:uncharacterized protein LOC113276349 [Papaver somniferum]
MSSESTMNASAPALPKDFGKKKRGNRLAKLKQCKLDAKREQWLSQGKNKGKNGTLPSPVINQNHEKEETSSKNSETRSRGGEDSSLHDSDLEFLTYSPTNSSVSGSKDSRKNLHIGGSSSSSSSCGSCSVSVSDEEDVRGEDDDDDDDDGCLDDWEAIADALTAEDLKVQNPSLELPSGSADDLGKERRVGALKPDCSKKIGQKVVTNCRAWRPDDVFRPQSLPNLAKQYSFPMNSERHFGRGGMNQGCHGISSQPSSCPICYEDLDLTDTSFIPCLCGFHLCLFCHKRILEADGRCPGCRKQYDSGNGENGIGGGAQKFRLARSCSMTGA